MTSNSLTFSPATQTDIYAYTRNPFIPFLKKFIFIYVLTL